jgi:hypothetical protein
MLRSAVGSMAVPDDSEWQGAGMSASGDPDSRPRTSEPYRQLIT